jgi:cation/acetate symporter
VIVLVSSLDRSARGQRERAAYDDQFVRAQTGLGAAAASSH